MAGVVCFAAGLGFVILLLVGALILRAAVAVTNRFVGPPAPAAPEDPYADWDWDGDLEDERARRAPERGVPEPGFGKGMMIASTVGVLTALFGVMAAGVLDAVDLDINHDEEVAVAVTVFTLPFSFFAAALVLVPMLPTTFGRAALVSLVYHAIGLGVAVAAVVLVAAVR